jgi:hypothetical protein
MLRVAGSLVTSQVRAYDLLRMFGRDGHPTPLGQAFIEYGRIAKTLHLLALVDPVDGSYQRRMNRQLTVQESRHRLGRKICHGHRGQIRQAYREGQEDQLAALGLVLNAVVLWNTVTSTPSCRACRPAVPARARAPQLPGSLRLHHPAACRAAAAARPERTRWRGRRRVLTSPARGSRRGTCDLSWPARADVTGTGDGRHGRESRFAAMLDL